MESALTLLQQYQTDHAQERTHRDMMIRLLLARGQESLARSCQPGHFTCSAWVLNAAGDSALLMHHAKLNMWLQPGGHCDGESDFIAVARKETEEETGLTNLTLLQPGIFDCDIHLIPARKNDPWHYHYDVRFLFQAAQHAILKKNHESHEIAWVPLNEVLLKNTDPSVVRLAQKTQASHSTL